MSTIEILSGTVEHGMIRLEEPLNLPEGQVIQFRILSSIQGSSHEDYIEKVDRIAGCLADLPQEDWDDLDAIVANRKNDADRKIEE